MGKELVIDVTRSQTRYAIIAILTGCLVIFLSNRPSYITRIIKSTITPKSIGSVGRLTPMFNSKLLKLTESGVRNTISRSRKSSEKTKSRMTSKSTGSKENQKNPLTIKIPFSTMKIAQIP